MKTSKLQKKNVQRNYIYDKIIKMPSKSHETIPLKPLAVPTSVAKRIKFAFDAG
jgi:hypothetical protein